MHYIKSNFPRLWYHLCRVLVPCEKVGCQQRNDCGERLILPFFFKQRRDVLPQGTHVVLFKALGSVQ